MSSPEQRAEGVRKCRGQVASVPFWMSPGAGVQRFFSRQQRPKCVYMLREGARGDRWKV